MIFSGNKTALGATTIPMAEGYDCSYGVGLALVESARNDLAVFKAMVQADYKEMAICKESTGVMQEGELASLIKKLIAKIKAIFHNFAAKFTALYMKDKELVKKYEKELGRKRNLDKLEVKWRKDKIDIAATVNKSVAEMDNNASSIAGDAGEWKEESFDRVKVYLSFDTSADSIDEYHKEVINDIIFDDEEEVKLSEIGGWRGVANEMVECGKALDKYDANLKKVTSNLEKIVNFRF